jgi:hypothetical protein
MNRYEFHTMNRYHRRYHKIHKCANKRSSQIVEQKVDFIDQDGLKFSVGFVPMILIIGIAVFNLGKI